MPTSFLNDLNAPLFAGSSGKDRVAALSVNNIPALQRAVENGIGIGVLPDYLNEPESGLVRLMTHAITPTLDCYLVFPEAMKNVARVRVGKRTEVAVLGIQTSKDETARTVTELQVWLGPGVCNKGG